MLGLQLYISCSVLIFSVTKGQLPAYIKACKVRTPTFRQCGIENGNAAIPVMIKGDKKFGIPNLNPLNVELIEFSSGDLKLTGTNVLVKGLPETHLKDIQVNLDEKTIYLEVFNPLVELDFHYQVGGKISSLPVSGEGPAKIDLYNTTYKYPFHYETYQKNGKDHLRFDKGDIHLEPAKITFKFDNLFDGNKVLGDNINKFLNENWPELLNDLRPGISKVFETVVKRILEKIFEKVPMQDIFLDY